MKTGVVLLAAALLCGCQTAKIALTPKIQPTASGKGIVELVTNPQLLTQMDVPSPLMSQVVQACPDVQRRDSNGQKLFDASIWIPVMVKLAFDTGSDWLASYVARVKKQSTHTYNARVVVDRDYFIKGGCLVVGRFSKKEPNKLSAITVLSAEKSNPLASELSLKPIFSWVNESIALTKCTDRCYPNGTEKEGAVGVSVAVVVTGIVPDESGVPQARQLATGSVSYPSVKIGSVGILNDGSLQDSEIMPATYPPKRLQLSVSVTEVGNIGGDFDKAAAEIAAVKSALGPAVQAQQAAKYKDD